MKFNCKLYACHKWSKCHKTFTANVEHFELDGEAYPRAIFVKDDDGVERLRHYTPECYKVEKGA